AASSPSMAAVSVDADAPGLAELMQGEASFTQVITKDKFSRVQLVSAGRPGFDRALLQSPRLTLAIDALLRVYDHVLLDAGTASDLPAELLTTNARAVVVPDAGMPTEARTAMCEQLKEVGFSEVTMLKKPVKPSDAVEAPGVAAAETGAALGATPPRMPAAACARGRTASGSASRGACRGSAMTSPSPRACRARSAGRSCRKSLRRSCRTGACSR